MNYNLIAPYYDILSRICFLNRQQLAHQLILKYIKPNDKIVWIGGGSGWFLKELDQLNIPLEIDYVEFSSIMINKAKALHLKNIKIKFIQENLLVYKPENEYNLVISAFIFDHFKEEDCKKIFKQLNQKLVKNGLWFYVDFNQNQTVIQRLLTKSMVFFFKIIAGIKTNDFPKIDYLFDDFKLLEQQSFFANYIQSKVYIK